MTDIKTIRLLIVEDVESDAGLIVRLFEKAGYEVIHERVDSADSMRAALSEKNWDAVISDFRMPDFSAVSALSLLKETGFDLPFVVASGTIGEDTAVAMMRYGAHDYLMKNNLVRMVPAVEREIKEAKIRLERKQTQSALIDSEARYRTLIMSARDGIALADIESDTIVDCNDALSVMVEREKTELVGKPQSILYPSDSLVDGLSPSFRELQTGNPNIISENLLISKTGKRISVEINATEIRMKEKDYLMGIFRDITERKKMENQIKTDLKEKETLLQEVHHRVKNNLQIMSSLLHMQSQQTQDKRLLEILKIYQGRIQSMALVHQMIYQNRDFSRIHVIQYINNMILALSKHYFYDSNQIRIKVSGQDLCLDLNRAIPCGMILNELIVNAIKHAFPDGRNGRIHIDLHEEAGSVLLRVRDNGVPLPRGFKANKTDTLGMKLISDLSEQLDGRFRVLTRKGSKTFMIEFMIDKT